MTKPSNKPTHRIYGVTKRGENEKGYWTEIGAAWPHKDGKGFSLSLNFLPLDAEIVIREPSTDEAAQGDAATSQAAA